VAGTVVESSATAFKPGDAVLVTGSGLSETRDGGFAEYLRLDSNWIIPLPTGLSSREAMIIGTAGFTAALSLHRMELAGQAPDQIQWLLNEALTEAIRQAKFAQDAGADGLLLGVPFYYQATVDNAVQFYHDVADALPKMGVMIYHNPTHHRVTIPVGAFKRITEKPNIVGMKDSHRTPLQFVELTNITKGKMSVFVNQTQMFPYATLGAAGCWSFNVWMGPSPVIRLRDACLAQDWEAAKQLCLDLDGVGKVGPNIGNLSWRENVFKLSVNEAGYCTAGPLRAPWRIVPQEVTDNSKKIAAYWKKLCEKYPIVSEPARKTA